MMEKSIEYTQKIQAADVKAFIVAAFSAAVTFHIVFCMKIFEIFCMERFIAEQDTHHFFFCLDLYCLI